MMRGVLLVVVLCTAQAALRSAPLATKKVNGHVQLSVAQQQAMHFGCTQKCKPSPVESKCVTECETAMYKCIDETGPNETPDDTKKCQDGVLSLKVAAKTDEKKAEKKEEKTEDKKEVKKEEKKEEKKEAKKEEKKAEKPAKSFLQVVDADDDDDMADSEDASEGMEEDGDASEAEQETDEEDDAEVSEEADVSEETAEDDADADAAEDTADAAEEEEEEEPAADEDEEESFVQLRNVDDDNTEAADMASTEDQIDKDEGEDEEEHSAADATSDEEETETDNTENADEEASFVQVSGKGNDDDNEEAADMASTEDHIDKVEGEGEEHSAAAATSDEDEHSAADASGDEEEESADNSAEDEESFMQMKSAWKPEPCDELEPGVPCTKLYEHPQGSTFVTPCPVESQTNTEACGAYFGAKADADKCPQISCPKALGVTMKLTCGGGCCPTCWAPDHVIKLDRHTSVDDAAVVPAAPQAPTTCGGVKCFKTACATGFTEGFVNGDCCYSCVPGR